MKKELVKIFEDTQHLPDAYEQIKFLVSKYDQIKNLPDKVLSEQYGRVTEYKITTWAVGCLLSYTLNKQGFTFKEIQQMILDNTQYPFYVDPATLWREAWIWENIISKASHLVKEPHLSKSWYKRMSQHKVPEPIKELEYVARRKEEESHKHKKYSISMWEEERGYAKRKKYKCAYCEEEMEYFHKICSNCFKEGI